MGFRRFRPPFYARWWFWTLVILGVGIVFSLIEMIPPGFFKSRVLPVIPVLFLLVYVVWLKGFLKDIRAARAYRENVIGFLSALSVVGLCPGVYLGDLYRMVDQELGRRKKTSELLPDYPVFALDVLASYAALEDLPSLLEFCRVTRQDADRFRVEYDLDPTGPLLY